MRCFEKWVCTIEKKKGFNAKIKMNFYYKLCNFSNKHSYHSVYDRKMCRIWTILSKIDSHQSLYNSVNL